MKRMAAALVIITAIWMMGGTAYGNHMGSAEQPPSWRVFLAEHLDTPMRSTPTELADVSAERIDSLRKGWQTWKGDYLNHLEVEEAEHAAMEAAAQAQQASISSVASSLGSSNPYVNPWGCEADELHENDNPPYYGKYQFDSDTWYAHDGGPCYETQSCTEAEQDAVAARVKYDAWPNC